MVRVAAVQFAPRFKEKSANVATMVRLAEEAAKGGAKLIVLPELATTGYSFMSAEEADPFGEPFAHFLSNEVSGCDSAEALYKVANQHKVAIVYGFVEKDTGNGKLYNSQAYLAPGGHVESYRKVNPWGNDYLWAQEGRSNPPVIDCAMTDKRVGLLICRDIRDKRDDAWTSFYSPGDADVVAFSTAWGDGGFPAVAWMDFVKENRVALVVSNRYGQETNNNFGEGGSCVIAPSGRVACAGLRWSEDCIVYGEV
jgi:predicted amidohydrolase